MWDLAFALTLALPHRGGGEGDGVVDDADLVAGNPPLRDPISQVAAGHDEAVGLPRPPAAQPLSAPRP